MSKEVLTKLISGLRACHALEYNGWLVVKNDGITAHYSVFKIGTSMNSMKFFKPVGRYSKDGHHDIYDADEAAERILEE